MSRHTLVKAFEQSLANLKEDQYQEMIEVNMRKSANRAVKTMVIFP